MKSGNGKVRLVSALCISFLCAFSSYAQNSDTMEYQQLDQASLAGALQKSGLTQTTYDNLLFTVTTAYSDVRDESRLVNPLPATIPGLPEKEAKEYAATLLEYETSSGFAVRRANLPLYEKHAADLDILIEEYDSLIR